MSKFVFDGIEHARKRREEQRQAEREAFAGLVLESSFSFVWLAAPALAYLAGQLLQFYRLLTGWAYL